MQNIFTHWESVINFARNDIVFEYQNKEYGAYTIRKYYPERLRNAFIYVLSGMGLLLGTAFLLPNKIKPPKPPTDIPYYITPIALDKPATVKPKLESSSRQTKKKTDNIKIDEDLDNKVPDKPDSPENPVSDPNANSDPSGNSPNDAGTEGGTIITPPDPDPSPIAAVMPEYIGGGIMLEKFLKSNIVYPAIARHEGISGRVYVTFVIDKNGKVKEAYIRRGGLGGGLEEEALRVVRLMPDWKPGRNNQGMPVPVLVTLPINFVLR